LQGRTANRLVLRLESVRSGRPQTMSVAVEPAARKRKGDDDDHNDSEAEQDGQRSRHEPVESSPVSVLLHGGDGIPSGGDHVPVERSVRCATRAPESVRGRSFASDRAASNSTSREPSNRGRRTQPLSTNASRYESGASRQDLAAFGGNACFSQAWPSSKNL
jgi:hypothetical protein